MRRASKHSSNAQKKTSFCNNATVPCFFRRSRLRFVVLTRNTWCHFVPMSDCLCHGCVARVDSENEQHIHSVASLVQYLSAVILTCTTLSFPGICSNAASLKLLAPLIPLKPQRLPLAFSHDGSVVFIVCGLIFSKAPRAPVNTANPLHSHTHKHARARTHTETDFTQFH